VPYHRSQLKYYTYAGILVKSFGKY